MPKTGKLKTLFILESLVSFLQAMTFLFMPFASHASGQSYKMVVGVFFWLLLLFQIIFFFWMRNEKNVYLFFHRDLENKLTKRPGILNFFQNKYATVADILFFISVFSFILTNIVWRFKVDTWNENLLFFFIFLTAFSFDMHCLLNGKTFQIFNIHS